MKTISFDLEVSLRLQLKKQQLIEYEIEMG